MIMTNWSKNSQFNKKTVFIGIKVGSHSFIHTLIHTICGQLLWRSGYLLIKFMGMLTRFLTPVATPLAPLQDRRLEGGAGGRPCSRAGALDRRF